MLCITGIFIDRMKNNLPAYRDKKKMAATQAVFRIRNLFSSDPDHRRKSLIRMMHGGGGHRWIRITCCNEAFLFHVSICVPMY